MFLSKTTVKTKTIHFGVNRQNVSQCEPMKSEDLKKAPKIFCESINVAFTPEYFILSLSSGDQSSIYSLTPQHAKRLQQYLTHQVAEFEKMHDEINALWTPNIISPIQKLNK